METQLGPPCCRVHVAGFEAEQHVAEGPVLLAVL